MTTNFVITVILHSHENNHWLPKDASMNMKVQILSSHINEIIRNKIVSIF